MPDCEFGRRAALSCGSCSPNWICQFPARSALPSPSPRPTRRDLHIVSVIAPAGRRWQRRYCLSYGVAQVRRFLTDSGRQSTLAHRVIHAANDSRADENEIQRPAHYRSRPEKRCFRNGTLQRFLKRKCPRPQLRARQRRAAPSHAESHICEGTCRPLNPNR